MIPSITVYTKPHCVQCDSTKRMLEKYGLPYEVKQIEDHPDVLEEAKAAGIMAAPIVTLSDGTAWGGFQHTKIKNLAIANGSWPGK